MSLNAMHRSVMVFSDTSEKAEEQLAKIIKELDEDILIQRKDFVKTKNNTYQARAFNDSCRGYRYKEVYVDACYKNTEEFSLILAKLVPPHYYINHSYDESYNWRDNIHYF